MQNSSTEEKLRPAERKVLLVRQGPRDWSQKCRGDFRIFISAVSGNYEFLKTKQMRVVHRGESTGTSLQQNVKISRALFASADIKTLEPKQKHKNIWS